MKIGNLLYIVCMAFILAGCAALGGPKTSMTEKEWKLSHLAPAPQGYSWYYFEPIKCFLLKRDGWHVQEEKNKYGHKINLSKNPTGEDPKKFTGFSLNSTKGVAKPHLGDEDEIDIRLRAIFVDLGIEVDKLKSIGDEEYFMGYSADILNEVDDNLRIISKVSTLVNKKSGTMYNVTLQAPQEAWNQVAERLFEMNSNIGFDPRY